MVATEYSPCRNWSYVVFLVVVVFHIPVCLGITCMCLLSDDSCPGLAVHQLNVCEDILYLECPCCVDALKVSVS